LGNKPLAGRGIVVTRPRDQAAGLATLIEAAGGHALLYPAIEIEDLPDPAAALNILKNLAQLDLAVFVSPTAVRKSFELMKKARSSWPAGLRAAAVGQGSRDELQRHGMQTVVAPESGADSEALLALPELADVAGKRIAIFRGEGGRELLGDTLAQRGAKVEYAACYRRTRPRLDVGPLLSAWGEGAVHAVTVSSTTGLANLAEMLGERGRSLLAGTPVFAPHPRVAEQVRRLGVRSALLAGPSDAEMMARLVAYFSEP
jgi:uroporphyrinogen-III synthase